MSEQPQKITKAKGRPLLQWVGKKPLDKIEYYPAQEKEVYGIKNSKEFNKLFWGDNLQVLSHLLKKHRGGIDLIYIDPPFDSKADYVKKVKLKGEQIEGEQQSIFEEKQYTDIWMKDEYLQFMYERLQIMRELLADTGSIYLHCDWHKGAYLRLLMDEVFGEENFRNEIVVRRVQKNFAENEYVKSLNNAYDTIFLYAKGDNLKIIPPRDKSNNNGKENWHSFDAPNWSGGRESLTYELFGHLPPTGNVWRWEKKRTEEAIKKGVLRPNNKTGKPEYLVSNSGKMLNNLWDDILAYSYSTKYPTEKSEKLLDRIIEISTKKGDVVMDCFCGSGTTMAVAQKLGRRWIGCDINMGAIQTTAKRLNQIIKEQSGKLDSRFRENDNLMAFKVYNVNDYDIFKNEIEAKEIVMEMYGVEPIKRTYFDGILDNNFVKVMSMNRVLNKLDIKTVLKNIKDRQGDFTVKKQSKIKEAIFEEGVLIICSGMELDCLDYLKKENKTGVNVEVRDILRDKKNLIFKKKPEAKIIVETQSFASGKKLDIEIKEFISPILMRKLEIENKKSLKKKHEAKVEDFKQIIDSVAIDIDYNGKLFNAEIMDVPSKKEIVKGKYEWAYKKAGKNTVAVKIVDVLGEEYFESFKV